MRSSKRRNKAPIEIAPGRFAVQTHDRVAVALVDIVHPKAVSVKIAWCKGPGLTECFVRRNHSSKAPGVMRQLLHYARVIFERPQVALQNVVALPAWRYTLRDTNVINDLSPDRR